MKLNFHIVGMKRDDWDSSLKPELLKSLNCLETLLLNLGNRIPVLEYK